MADQPETNWRLERIANSICVCDLTDGFCSPRNKPDCKCWKYARLAVHGLRNSANPVLHAAFPYLHEDECRFGLERLCDGILNQSDSLTEEHAASRQKGEK